MYVDPSGYREVMEAYYIGSEETNYPFFNTDSNSSSTSPLGTYDNESSTDGSNADGGVTNGPVLKLATKVFSEALNKVTADAIEEVALKGTKIIAKDYVKHIPFAGYTVGTVLDANKYGWGGAAKKNLIDTGAELAVTGVIALTLFATTAVAAPAVFIGSLALGIFDIRASRLFGYKRNIR